MFSNDEVRGGTPYGASTRAGADGSRQPSTLELDLAEHQVGGAPAGGWVHLFAQLPCAAGAASGCMGRVCGWAEGWRGSRPCGAKPVAVTWGLGD